MFEGDEGDWRCLGKGKQLRRSPWRAVVSCLCILQLLVFCQHRRHNTLCLTLLTALTLLTSLPELALARIQLAESHTDAWMAWESEIYTLLNHRNVLLCLWLASVGKCVCVCVFIHAYEDQFVFQTFWLRSFLGPWICVWIYGSNQILDKGRTPLVLLHLTLIVILFNYLNVVTERLGTSESLNKHYYSLPF